MSKARELLGKNIRRLREARLWTQADLAEATDLSVNMIQKLEYGKTNPSTKTLDLLAKSLRAELPELFGAQPASAAKPSQAGLSLQEAAKLLEAVAQASEVRRAILLAIAHNDEKYLDALELPAELSRGLKSISKAI